MTAELIANSPTPGTRVELTTLAAAISSTTATSFTTHDAAPTDLQGAGQFRVIAGSEIMIITAGADGTTWTVGTRGAEGSTPATHANGTKIYHDLTKGALDARYVQADGSNLPSLVVTGTGTPTAGQVPVYTGTGNETTPGTGGGGTSIRDASNGETVTLDTENTLAIEEGDTEVWFTCELSPSSGNVCDLNITGIADIDSPVLKILIRGGQDSTGGRMLTISTDGGNTTTVNLSDGASQPEATWDLPLSYVAGTSLRVGSV